MHYFMSLDHFLEKTGLGMIIPAWWVYIHPWMLIGTANFPASSASILDCYKGGG